MPKYPTADAPLVAVVVAAGVGKRFGADKPKQYLPLADSCVLGVTLERLLRLPEISQLLLVVSRDDQWVDSLGLESKPRIKRIEGGAERVDSVAKACEWMSRQGLSSNTRVMIHDAARPCVRPTDIRQLLSFHAETGKAGILSAPVSDTIKQVVSNTSGASHPIDHTPRRALLRRALTPQLMTLEQLQKGLAAASERELVTDDASLLELAGIEVHCIAGSPDNIKITHPADLLLAEAILRQQQEESTCE